MNTDRVLNALEAAVGKDNVAVDEVIRTTYAFDSSPNTPGMPDFVVLPRNTEHVKAIMSVAQRFKIPVIPISGGVNVGGMCIPKNGGIILDMRWMDKIIKVDTDAAYALIEPGVTFDQLTARLRQDGYRCHVPTAPGGATPMGNYLVRPSGSLSNRHLDSLLSLEVVLPGGNVLNTGSSAFSTGGWHSRYGPFPDLTGLFTCSYGTLGVVTKAAIRIYPLNEAQKLPMAAFDSFNDSMEFVKELVRSNLVEHAIIWNRHFYRTYDISFPKDSEPVIPADLFEDPRMVMPEYPYNIVTCHMTGFADDLKTHEEICQRRAEAHHGHLLSAEECQDKLPGILRSWQQFYMEHRQPKMEHNKKYGLGRYVPWIVQAEPGTIVKIEHEALTRAYDLGLTPICYYSQPFDYGRSMFFRMFSFADQENPELLGEIAATYKDMYEWALNRYGAVPFRHRRDQSMPARLGGYYELLKSIKRMVDPDNIMNPTINLF